MIDPNLELLEREAKAKGFGVFRTGQFGIGLLSYFIKADRKVEIRLPSVAK